LFGVIGALVLVLVFTLIALRRKPAEQEGDYLDEASLDEASYVPESKGVLEAEASVGLEQEYDDEKEAITEAQVEPTVGDLDDLIEAENTATGGDAMLVSDDAEDETEYYIEDDEEDDEEDESQDELDTTNVASDGQSQTGDVIGEAEIYIAYGRYGQAANLLSGVLNAEPERWDVRLKLLEVCVESQDQASFATHAQYLIDNCDDDNVLMACRELEAQLGDAQVDLGTDTAEDEAPSDSAEGALPDSAADSSDDSFDFDLGGVESVAEADEPTDLGLDLDSDDDSDADTSIDFELEFDDADAVEKDVPAEAAAVDDTVIAGEQLGGDLGIDFDPEKDVDLDLEDSPVDSETSSIDVDSDLDDLLAELPGGDEVAEEEVEEEIEEDMTVDYASAATQGGEDEAELEVVGDDVVTDSTTIAADDSSPVEDLEGPADDFDFESDSDINATKLDLAEAYVDMGDADGAQDILKEVLEEGTPEQKQKAQQMLDSLDA